jgi:hypothetical protein
MTKPTKLAQHAAAIVNASDEQGIFLALGALPLRIIFRDHLFSQKPEDSATS